MAGIVPVPTSRVSDLLIRQRLMSQLQSDQQSLFNIQNQISTGRRISLPSEDAPAAIRAIALQDILERKAQAQTNVATNQSFLSATDVALSSVSGMLSEVRGTALSVVGTTSTDLQRQAAVQEVRRAIEQLVDVGNHQFRGRYLFAGSRTGERPFAVDGSLVGYDGDERTLQSYADIDLLFETNANGNSVFGVISEPSRGTADLTPTLSEDTRLADLRGGAGIGRGSIRISDQAYSSVIDLSSAETIRDVVELIEAQPPGYNAVPPGGRSLTVNVTATGLNITMSGGTGGLVIREVGGGTTASELGIRNENDFGIPTVNGEDLDPRLNLTTSLNNILGVRPQATVTSSGNDNDLIIEATTRGAAYNGVRVQFVEDGLLRPGAGLSAGNETAQFTTTAIAARASLEFGPTANNDLLLIATSTGTALNDIAISLATRTPDGNGVQITYNALAGNYSISVEDGVTTAADVANAITAHGGSGGPFNAALDTSVDLTNNGSYVFTSGDANAVVGNTGNSGAAANTLLVSIRGGSTNANQVASAINNTPAVAALFSARLSLKDTTQTLSAGLGKVNIDATAVTTGGSGVQFDQNSGIRIINGGQTHVISFASAETVEDMLNILNGSDAGVVAQINASGRGIDIRSRVSGADFAIGENGGTTATELGLRTFVGASRLDDFNHGFGVRTTDSGADLTIRRTDGVELEIDLSTASTVNDVLDAINNHANNQNPATRVVASLPSVGNGIQLREATPTVGGTLQVRRAGISFAAIDLGLVAEGETTSAAPTTNTDGSVSLVSTDNHRQETNGLFNSLIRLAAALEANDQPQIQRAIAMMDGDLERVILSRGEIGTRQQGLDILTSRLGDEEIELKRVLSDEIDVDLAQAISDLVGRQSALEASLRMTAQTLQLSLMDFL